MVEDINVILSKDRDAIIIIAGDHGAYLTGNCRGQADPNDKSKNNITQFADTHGLFIAVRWPDNDYKDFDQFNTIQDLFLSVIAYMSQDKTPLSFMSQEKICHYKDCASVDGTLLTGKHKGRNLFDAIQDYPLEVYQP